MEVQYKRNYNESYMVIETEESCSDYEEQMTRQNEICCLLSFYTMEMNHRIQFWYQVTGKESLEEYLRREGISFEILDMILCSLNAACDEIKKYLLRQERICLRPETVYLCRKEGKLQMFLCYCPIEMQDLYEQFRGIMEFVLTLLEEDQQEIADACYELYDITLREHYHFSQLIECVRAKMETKTEKEEETSEIQQLESRREFGQDLEEIPLMEPLEFGEQDSIPQKEMHHSQPREKTFPPFLLKFTEMVKKEVETVRELLPMLAAGDNQAGKEKWPRLQYQGKGDEQDYIIDKKVFLIGSYLEENDACLHSQTVSRYHARIFSREESYYLEDLGSENGTYLNGQRLRQRQQEELNAMDEIRFGDVVYIFYE